MATKLLNPARANYLLEAAKKVYGIDPKQKTRETLRVFARRAISVQLLDAEERYANIASFLNQHHTSVIHSVRKHHDSLAFDKEYKKLYGEFLVEIGEPINKSKLVLAEFKTEVNRLNNALLKTGYNFEEIMNLWNDTINEANSTRNDRIN